MEEKDIPKSRFEAEMMRKIDLLIQKTIGLGTRFDGLETRFDNLEKDVSEIKTDVSEIKSDVRVLNGQFNDVAVMAIQDDQRITKPESDVTELQSNIH